MRLWFTAEPSGRSASRWFIRLQAADVSDATDRAFRRWLDRRLENEREFERRELLWELLGDLRDDAQIAQLTQAAANGELSPRVRDKKALPGACAVGNCARAYRDVLAASPGRAFLSRALHNRWRLRGRGGWGVAAAATATVAAAITTITLLSTWHRNAGAPSAHVAAAPAETVFTTKTGEQKQFVLADGSQVQLNTATRLRVRFSDKARLLYLDQGEAIFIVQRDARRPFEVTAGETRTRALGTTFNVLYLNDRTDIAVLDGRVQVEARSGPTTQRETQLTKGQGTTYNKEAGLGPVVPANLERISLWQARRIEFHDVTLAAAAAEFNRYSNTKILINDPAIEAVRVSGVFHFDDVTAFAKALRSGFGIRSQVEGRTLVLTGARHPGFR